MLYFLTSPNEHFRIMAEAGNSEIVSFHMNALFCQQDSVTWHVQLVPPPGELDETYASSLILLAYSLHYMNTHTAVRRGPNHSHS